MNTEKRDLLVQLMTEYNDTQDTAILDLGKAMEGATQFRDFLGESADKFLPNSPYGGVVTGFIKAFDSFNDFLQKKAVVINEKRNPTPAPETEVPTTEPIQND